MGGSEAAVLDEKLAGEGHAVPNLFGVEVGELDHHARAPVVDRGDAEALELGARLGGGLGEGTDVQRRGIGGGAGRERFAAARCTARETAYVPAGRVRFPLEEPAASSPGTEPEAPRPPPPPAPRLGLGELSPVATHSARTNASTRVGSLMRKSYRRPDRSSRARLAHRGVRSRGASELPRIPTHRGETLTTTNIRLRRVNRAGGGRTSDARAVGQMSGCQFRRATIDRASRWLTSWRRRVATSGRTRCPPPVSPRAVGGRCPLPRARTVPLACPR